SQAHNWSFPRRVGRVFEAHRQAQSASKASQRLTSKTYSCSYQPSFPLNRSPSMRRSLCFVALVAFLCPLVARADQPFRYTDGTCAPAELKYVNDLPVLFVSGTPEEIGEQTAALTKEPLKRLINFAPDLLKAFGQEKRLPLLKIVSTSMLPQFPPDHLKEFESLGKHSGLDRDLGIIGNTWADISKTAGCSVLIVNAERSATGQPFFGRNLDYLTAGVLHEYSMVQIVRPKGKHAFAAVGFPGSL